LKGTIKETNVQVLCFQRGPQEQLQCVSNLLSQGPQQQL